MNKINPEEYKMINGKPKITPDMIAEPNGTERIVVSCAIDIMRHLKEPLHGFENVSGMQVPVTHSEAEQPIVEFKMEWPRWPVPESYVDKLCRDLSLAIKGNMTKKGLIR